MKIQATMRVLQLTKEQRLEEVFLPVPSPKGNEVLIKTLATTICTSDINDIAHNPFNIVLPRVLGHEGAGRIVAKGKNVEHLQLGDRVGVHPVISCGTCANCLRDLAHLCTHMGHLGIDRNGTFAEYFCIPADRVRQVPPGVEMAAAALLEPVSVCLQATERARIQPGETVVIVGDGPFGILIGRLALRYKPGKLILVGQHEFRLKQIPGIRPILYDAKIDMIAAVKSAADGMAADVAILATDNAPAVDLCIGCLRARGRMVVFSAVQGPSHVDLFKVHTQELEILGCCNDGNLVNSALKNMTEPDLNLPALVTHRLPFSKWRLAFELASQRKQEALKVALMFEG